MSYQGPSSLPSLAYIHVLRDARCVIVDEGKGMMDFFPSSPFIPIYTHLHNHQPHTFCVQLTKHHRLTSLLPYLATEDRIVKDSTRQVWYHHTALNNNTWHHDESSSPPQPPPSSQKQCPCWGFMDPEFSKLWAHKTRMGAGILSALAALTQLGFAQLRYGTCRSG